MSTYAFNSLSKRKRYEGKTILSGNKNPVANIE